MPCSRRMALARKLNSLNCDENANVCEASLAHVCIGLSSRFMNKRSMCGQAYRPTESEHIANMVTHGLWVLPSMAGLGWMLHLSTSFVQRVIALTYGTSLLALFSVSTAFHVLAYCHCWDDGSKFRKLKNWFHIGDRAVIYIFIAASYTPWLTLKEYNNSAALVLCCVWVAAILGIIYQYTFHERYKWLEIIFYVGLGVLPSFVVIELKDSSGFQELALGGAVYIAGVVFFKCDGIVPFAHAIWHCFVFTGALLHFSAVCRHLLLNTNSIHTEFTES